MLQHELLRTLAEGTSTLRDTAYGHKQLTTERLTQRPGPGRWNALECYEHMVRYGSVYIAYFEEALLKARPVQGRPAHRPGLIGGYSARSMEPQEVGVRMAMRTFASMDPMGTEPDTQVVDRFIAQQEALLALLAKAEGVDIDRVKCRTTIKWLRFKLSDALHFYTNHARRHQLQAERAVS